MSEKFINQLGISTLISLVKDAISDIPNVIKTITEEDINNWNSKTNNTGTVTGVLMNGIVKSPNNEGLINLGTIITDISNKANKFETISNLQLTLDPINYRLTLSGRRADGSSFVVNTLDLPIELLIIDGRYDSNTKKIILILQNEHTIEFSIANLISGLQQEITSENKLSADLISDGEINKTVTLTEKDTWSGKQDALTFDTAPTLNSINPVTSGGVKTAIDNVDNVFKVTLTWNVSEQAYIADKTATEILAAAEAHKYVIAVNNYVDAQNIPAAPMTYIEDDGVVEFSFVDSYGQYHIFTLSDWGNGGNVYTESLEYIHLPLQELDDVQELIFRYNNTWTCNLSYSQVYTIYNRFNRTTLIGCMESFPREVGNQWHITGVLYCFGYYENGNFMFPFYMESGGSRGFVTVSLNSNNTITYTISVLQPLLVSGTNIKTINNTSVLGSGNIDTKEFYDISIDDYLTIAQVLSNASPTLSAINAACENIYAAITANKTPRIGYPSSTLISNEYGTILSYGFHSGDEMFVNFLGRNGELYHIVATGIPQDDDDWTITYETIIPQEALESGVNIKTVNNTSLLGNGNIDVEDIIYGKLDNDLFYEITGYNLTTATYSLLPILNPSDKKIYVDIPTKTLYWYYNGSILVNTSRWRTISKEDLSSYADGAEYDSTSHLIYLKHGNTRLSNPINAADFIKDGMVSTVTVDTPSTGINTGVACLIVTFNTDAGTSPIELPISQIFNANNYYTKTEIDNAGYLTSYTETDPIFSASVAAGITSSDISNWGGKQDTLVSGTNIKTINSGSILGSGNLALATSADLSNYCPIIEDTRSSSVAAITGTAPFATLEDGQRIVLHFKYRNEASPTLQLTLSGGTTTSAYPIYQNYNSGLGALTVQAMPAGSYGEFIYDQTNSRWMLIGKDVNTTYSNTSQADINNSAQGSRLIEPALLRTNFYLKSEATPKRLYVDNSADASVQLAVTTYNDLGTLSTWKTITLPATYDRADEFIFRFTCNDASLTPTLPSGVVMADNFEWSEMAVGVVFQVSICDGIAAYLCLTPNA